jgi:hypothetical protein
MDELSVAFEGSRKVVNIAIDKICEFTGTSFSPVHKQLGW